MTPCKLLELQELLHKAFNEDDKAALAAALVIIDQEVAEMLFTDEEESELDALYKED